LGGGEIRIVTECVALGDQNGKEKKGKKKRVQEGNTIHKRRKKRVGAKAPSRQVLKVSCRHLEILVGDLRRKWDWFTYKT